MLADGKDLSLQEYNKSYREKNRETLRENQRRYYEKNKEVVLQRQRKFKEENKERLREEGFKRKQESPAITMLTKAKYRAKAKGLEFSIAEEDITVPVFCPILGLPLTYNPGEGKTDASYSLDRIDPTKGYIPGNIQVMSSLANVMKNKATPEQLLLFADWIYKTYGK